ncbi:hypothetical protein [Bradyrhizobium erythrophlei]|jgi:hypothetical protein|uniref:hypothetical protein n=1 Tax=Bradyrhizobium erythrophlei TaxID=1437360 RepID=UPI001560EA89|nr:hypothetical protein [Bradyrhizobium erythrophlei]
METAVEAATKAPGRRCGWCNGAECCSRKRSDHHLPEHNPILLDENQDYVSTSSAGAKFGNRNDELII